MADEPESPSARANDAESTWALVERARAGDEDAVNRLFARHAPRLRRWAAGRLPQRVRGMADTDDVVQEALIQTFKRIGAFEVRGVGALQAYLRQSVLNGIRAGLRQRGRRPDMTDFKGLEADPGPSPLEQAIGQQALDRYEEALARLKPEDREAIVARLELGLSYDELAEALGKPTADAARKAAHRATLRLIQEMERARA